METIYADNVLPELYLGEKEKFNYFCLASAINLLEKTAVKGELPTTFFSKVVFCKRKRSEIINTSLIPCIYYLKGFFH